MKRVTSNRHPVGYGEQVVLSLCRLDPFVTMLEKGLEISLLLRLEQPSSIKKADESQNPVNDERHGEGSEQLACCKLYRMIPFIFSSP